MVTCGKVFGNSGTVEVAGLKIFFSNLEFEGLIERIDRIKSS